MCSREVIRCTTFSPVLTSRNYSLINIFGYFRPRRTFLISDPSFVRTVPDYGFAIGWNDKGWSIETGAQRIFTNTKAQENYFDYANVYNFKSKSFSDNLGKMVYVRIAYSFDFGRKVKRTQIELNHGPQSGILHP